MADNDQNNDEYKLDELDNFSDENMGEFDSSSKNYNKTDDYTAVGKKDVKRNALIAIGVVLFALIMYKFIGSMFSKKPEPAQSSITPVTQTTPQPVVPAPVVTEPPPAPAPVIQADPELKQKVSALDVSQQGLRSDVTTLGNRVDSLSTQMNNLNTQVEKLTQLITELSNQVTRQSEEINTLMVRTQPKRVKPVSRVFKPQVFYYIQAIIPGRAWLISTNGSTLTVREGTNIPGYGVVKLIDSIQGRVLTSSGKVIKFSQEDS